MCLRRVLPTPSDSRALVGLARAPLPMGRSASRRLDRGPPSRHRCRATSSSKTSELKHHHRRDRQTDRRVEGVQPPRATSPRRTGAGISASHPWIAAEVISSAAVSASALAWSPWARVSRRRCDFVRFLAGAATWAMGPRGRGLLAGQRLAPATSQGRSRRPSNSLPC